MICSENGQLDRLSTFLNFLKISSAENRFFIVAVLVIKVYSLISLYFIFLLEISPIQSFGTIATTIPVSAHNNIV